MKANKGSNCSWICLHNLSNLISNDLFRIWASSSVECFHKLDNSIVSFDETPTVLDNLLFKDMVEKKRVLLATDQAMANYKRTAMFVKRLEEDPNLFSMKFGEVMSRMSSLGVLIGK
ncbi:peroxidase 28-like [Senna tora]|uniref:Peroxidase 28-like n=1 Tax=Senna tora TaxID=362788 RepID=A0A834TK04_9FABA|nr:peroxidase 28-like [Senna tora]